MPESISTPITDVLLKENDNLALIFPEDISNEPEFELFFFRTMRRYPLHRVYDSEMPEIPEGGTIDFRYLGKDGLGSGDDILEVWEERPFRILHFTFGISPKDIWLYKAIPADVSQTGLGYETPTKIGDKHDFIDGELSPYENPTVAAETVIYHKLSATIGLKNNYSFPIKPKLKILGAGYDVLPITDREFINKMLAGVKPVRYITVGGLRQFTYTVPEEWKANKVIVDKETVEKVMSRR